MLLTLPARIGLALTLGVLATFAFAPFGQCWLLPLALAGLFALAEGRSFWRAAGYGWLFGFAHFTSGIYWIYISTHVYGEAPAWLAVALCIVLFGYMAIYPALVTGLGSALNLFRRPIGWLLLPALWTLGELLRGWVYSGFPWLSLGYASLDTPLVKFAPLGGIYFVSMLIATMGLALFRLARVRARRAISAAVLLAPLLVGLILPQPSAWTEAVGAPLRVALVQADVRQDSKFAPEMREVMLERHRAMTERALAGDGTDDSQVPDLVLWPESALPMALSSVPAWYFDALRQKLRAHGGTLILGSLVIEPAPDRKPPRRVFNSAVAIGSSEQRYDKRHLVPFGEYFPIPDFLRPLMAVLGTEYADIDAGPPKQPLFEVRGHKVFVGICFEDVFGSEFRHDAADAAFQVNLTNDAWFGHSGATLQHLQFSRLRAIEYGRELVRSTTTGVSAWIDADGRVTRQGGEFDQELLSGSVQPRSGLTPYVRWGDWPLWLLTAPLGFYAVAAAWRQRGKKASSPAQTPSASST